MVSLKNPNEAAELLADLLGSQELLMLAKRLYIAKLLLDKYTYEEITKELNTSSATVARINIWLKQYGAGYKRVISRIKGKKTAIPDKPAPLKGIDDYFSWAATRRRYHSVDIMIDDIIKITKKNQRKKIIDALTALDKSKQKKNIRL